MGPSASDSHSQGSARPTLAAVAARAGVSASTASLAFSGTGPVSAATRDRVLAAAADLDYAGPDPTARSLRRGRSGVIGVVTEDRLADTFHDPINLALLDGIGDALGDERIGLLVIPLAGQEGTDLASAPMDAAILLGCSTDLAASVAALGRRRIPLVAIEAAAMPGVIAIDIDNRKSSRVAAQHLRDLGHTRVEMVTLPLDASHDRGTLSTERERAATSHPALERMAGVREVFPDAGGVSAGGSTIDEGIAAGRALLGRPASDRPTAVIAQSDLLAIGVIRAAEELSLAVPHDVSVLGFDGIRLEGATVHDLTTVVQPAIEKGRAAAAAVLDALAGRPAERRELTCELHVGSTTAPPPG